jgi:hypothetical protein
VGRCDWHDDEDVYLDQVLEEDVKHFPLLEKVVNALATNAREHVANPTAILHQRVSESRANREDHTVVGTSMYSLQSPPFPKPSEPTLPDHISNS